MAKENTEYNMAEDLLRDLDALVERLQYFEDLAADSDTQTWLIRQVALKGLRKTAQRARKIAQVYYDRVK